MTIPGSANPLLLKAPAGGGGGGEYTIERSVRFNGSDSAYLSRVNSTAGSLTTWTWSGWVKLSYLDDAYPCLFGGGTSGNRFFVRYEKSPGTWEIYTDPPNGGSVERHSTVAAFRDYAAWAHYVLIWDTSNATASDRCRFYVNGILQQLDGTFSQNIQSSVNNNSEQQIGKEPGYERYLDGYLADIHFIDGQALDPTSFGEFDDNGIWQPKAYSGSYGTNGFHLDFSDNSTAAALGTDTSGNSNTWTVNNISVTDGFTASYDVVPTAPGDAFDGNINTYAYGPSATTITFSPPLTAIANRLDLHARTGWTWTAATNLGTVTVADTGVAWPSGGSYNGWYSYSNASLTTIYSISVSAGANWTISGVQIAGSPAVVGTQLLVQGVGGNDSLVDVPTNGTETDTGLGGQVRGNYCTLNPLNQAANVTLSNGNLQIDTAATNVGAFTTFGLSTGKWYFEATLLNASGTPSVGVVPASWARNFVGSSGGGVGYHVNGIIYDNLVQVQTGLVTCTTNDVVGVAFDLDAGSVAFYKNGSQIGTTVTGLTGVLFPAISGQTSSSLAVNFGQRSFAYTAPSGFKALCTANLPAPVITKPSEYMDVALWTGDGSASRSISLPIAGDLVWAKKRSATNSHQIADTVRGDNAILLSNGTNAESDPVTDFVGGGISSITTTEFVISQGTSDNNNLNLLNGTHVAWTWDAGSNSSKTYTVTVPGGVGGGFYIDGDQKPTINLEEGSTYTFDQSDSSNSEHPFKFSETSDGTHGAGTEYTTNVTTFGTPGSVGAYTRIEVAASAPTLYYYCSNHSAMGGQINTNSTAGASNFDGSIPSVVRANPSAGFSIVTYTGTGSNATVGHGLGVQPQFLIIKCRDTAGDQSWIVSHTSIGLGSGRLILNSTQANSTNGDSVLWNSTAPTSSVFSLGNYSAVNGSTLKYVAYCFAPVEGYSAFGSYTGNGSADGPYVFTNHRPRWILLKRTDTTSNWTIIDTAREGYNVDNDPLYANLSDAEGTTDLADILSNGFKLRSTDASVNANAGTYIFASFAEQPFSLARAR